MEENGDFDLVQQQNIASVTKRFDAIRTHLSDLGRWILEARIAWRLRGEYAKGNARMPRTVELTEIPNAGDDLEDYIAALFQSSGYFVEKSIIERAPDEVLELDIVATDYRIAPPRTVLAEVKGGQWGYPDIFKVIGWLKYLRQDEGVFCVKDSKKDDLQSLVDRVGPLGVKLLEFSDFSESTVTFSGAGLGTPVSTDLISLWRHSYQVERKLTRLVQARAKSDKDKEGPVQALGYQRLINNGTFFATSPVHSLQMLYDAYKEHPKLTLSSALEADGEAYDPQPPAGTKSDKLSQAMRDGGQRFVQACMFVEHRARLAILKAAVDYAIANPDGPPELKLGEGIDRWDALMYHALPKTCHAGLNWLWEQDHFSLYATFWQQFLWGWGGFYLEDRMEEEFAWMSQYSGIPADEIPVALDAFDQFFPHPNGWLARPGWTDARCVKMTPMVFQGLGAHHRRQQYGLGDNISQLQPHCQYTVSDLVKWNNCAVDFLTD